ncbi:MAG: GDSL-type esterase/lipase family protein [Polyangiales bacterium]
MRARPWLALSFVASVAGCFSGGPEVVVDHDASTSGVVVTDDVQFVDRPAVDAGAPDVATTPDAGSVDTGSVDAGSVDTGSHDAGPDDVGAPDAGPADVGALDSGPRDAGANDTGPRDVGTNDTGPRDTGTPDTGSVDAGTVPSTNPALPAWDAATVAHVREVRAAGQAMGNRAGVFAKIGDSITESGSFLFDVGFGWEDLGANTALAPTVAFFRATTLSGRDINSFNRASVCATAGWTTADALAGGTNSPLQRELRAIRPAWAIVMYGTNDVDRLPTATFRANLETIVDQIEAAGTVPAVSTIPDRADSAAAETRALEVNAAIRAVAAARHVPLLDYWAALQPLPSHGVSSDGIHPNAYVADGVTSACTLTAAGLRYGYNVRNLTAIQMLDRMRALP